MKFLKFCGIFAFLLLSFSKIFILEKNIDMASSSFGLAPAYISAYEITDTKIT
jgi:hypothetical protein